MANPELADQFTATAQNEVFHQKSLNLHKDINQEDNKYARDKLALLHIGLVKWCAKKYYHTRNKDIVQAGFIGLLEAIDKWEPKKGRLSAYAVWHIRKQMHEAHWEAQNFKLHSNLRAKVRSFNVHASILTQHLGRKPDEQELAELLKIPTKKVRILQCFNKKFASLDVEIPADKSLETTDEENLAFASEEVWSEELCGTNLSHSCNEDLESDHELYLLERSKQIEKVLNSLPEREKEILLRRFNLGDDCTGEQTLKEVGSVLKIDKERVRQIEARAIRHLQTPPRVQLLEDFLPS